MTLSGPLEDSCPTCGQALPEAKRKELNDNRARIIAERDKCLQLVDEASTREKAALEAMALVRDPDPFYPVEYPGAAAMVELEADLSLCDEDGARKTLRDADIADERIGEACRRKSTAEEAIARKTAEAAAVEIAESEVDDARAALTEADRSYEAERTAYADALSRIAALNAAVDALSKALAAAVKRREAREAARSQMGTRDAELSDWRTLERACGPDGIQALELDALAPSIAAVANRLLSVQSARHAVEFRTTRIAGKGGKTKQVETFEIFVLDSETGTEQEIGTLSGGEGVWIKRAVYDAFAAIRAQNTGIRFLTVMQDETDGALDPAARMAYLRMMEAAHAESGRHQTLLITHSTELQAMVAQTIDVWALDGRRVEEVAA
jgi:DNA repair exonuclease SbcCD ATPase subunit